MTIFVGVDPGLTGAMAFLSEKHGLIAVVDLPTMVIDVAGPKTTVKREIDVCALRDLLHRWVPADEKATAVMEHASAMGMPGLQAAASLAATKASIVATVRLAGIPLHRVTPQAWKRAYGVGRDKAMAIDAARRLFGPAGFERAKDHNRAESALIAHWALRSMA